MDVNQKFLDELDIFKEEEERNFNLKVNAATVLGLLLLFLPPSGLRWDGSVRSALDKAPLTQEEIVSLQPNAILNRSLRILSVLMGLALTAYGTNLDRKDLKGIARKRKKKEALEILEEEHLNSQIVKYLPQEEQTQTQTPVLSAKQKLAQFFGSDMEELTEADTPEALAAKFKTTSNASSAIVDATVVEVPKEQAKSRSKEVAQAIYNVEAPTATQTPEDKYLKFAEIGASIVKAMVITEKSILIASGTGTGKTTTEQFLLAGLMQHYPNTTFYALLQKNDPLKGVKPENTAIFDNMLLDRYLNQGDSEDESPILLRNFLEPLFRTYEEFYNRKQLAPTVRDQLKRESPIRLILGDWFATYQELKRLHKKDLDHVMSMIRQIITVGRDSGVSLVVDSQSASLASLGLAEDASIRESLDIYSQGYVRLVDDAEKGEVRTMMLIINNNSMVGKEDREGLTKAHLLLTNGIRNGEVRSPIIVTTVGSVPRIGIVPDLSNSTVRDNEEKLTTVETSESIPKRHVLDEPEEEIVNLFFNEEDSAEEAIRYKEAGILLYILNSAKVYPVPLKNIRRSKVWSKYGFSEPGSEKIRELGSFLVGTSWASEITKDVWIVDPE